MIRVLVVTFVGLIVLLSIDFNTSPPQINPAVLLFGILVAWIIWLTSRAKFQPRTCVGCGRAIPWEARVCPHCGREYPPLLKP